MVFFPAKELPFLKRKIFHTLIGIFVVNVVELNSGLPQFTAEKLQRGQCRFQAYAALKSLPETLERSGSGCVEVCVL